MCSANVSWCEVHINSETRNHGDSVTSSNARILTIASLSKHPFLPQLLISDGGPNRVSGSSELLAVFHNTAVSATESHCWPREWHHLSLSCFPLDYKADTLHPKSCQNYCSDIWLVSSSSAVWRYCRLCGLCGCVSVYYHCHVGKKYRIFFFF